MPSLSSVGFSSVPLAMPVAAPPAAGRPASIGDTPAPATGTPSTVLQLETLPAVSVVYSRPTPPSSFPRSWAQPPGDALSTLMDRNLGSGGSLASQWRGLGGALLQRAAQASGNYTQTLALHSDAVTADNALWGTRDQAVGLQLQIRTQSGGTVDLSIDVQRGNKTVLGGLRVGLQSTGTLTDAERQAVASLSEGLEQALAGLGRAEGPTLDLAGLLSYDDTQLSSLALSVRNPSPGDPLRSFHLQLDARTQDLQWKNQAGTMALRVDRAPPMDSQGTQQREAAVAQYLAQFDAAALRGHVDTEFIAQFKQAFAQMHAASATSATDDTVRGATPATLLQVAPLLSGLADFEVRFDGAFSRSNKYGFVVERSQVRYEASQQTTLQPQHRRGDLEVTQTQATSLQAQILRSLGEGEMDFQGGNYYRIEIDDSSGRSSTITTLDERLEQALEANSRRLLLRHTKVLQHRAVETRETPHNEQSTHDLLRRAQRDAPREVQA